VGVLAEIIDKMPTIPQMWIGMVLISVLLVIPALIKRRIVVYAFTTGIILTSVFAYYSYHEAYLEPDFSQSIQRELGTLWAVNSIVSTVCPALFTGVLYWRHIRLGNKFNG
jgi:hypothetical protein